MGGKQGCICIWIRICTTEGIDLCMYLPMYNTTHVIQSVAWMYIVIHYKFIGWEKTDFDSSWCTHTFRFLKVCSFQAFIGWSVQEMAACKVQLCKHRYFRRSSCFLVAVGLSLGLHPDFPEHCPISEQHTRICSWHTLTCATCSRMFASILACV